MGGEPIIGEDGVGRIVEHLGALHNDIDAAANKFKVDLTELVQGRSYPKSNRVEQTVATIDNDIIDPKRKSTLDLRLLGVRLVHKVIVEGRLWIALESNWGNHHDRVRRL